MTGTHAAFIAATRFGLGAGPKELTSIGPDPQGWLLSQLSQPATHPRELMNQPSAASRITEYLKVRKGSRDLKETIRKQFKKDYMREAGLRSLTALRSDTPLRERLVAFWSNHFTVSVQRPILFGIVGAFEREAIRPHVNGRFADMLLAVVQHPAMLVYLDNIRSIGPNSLAGKRRKKGLNENLAREILELHTVGVGAGYDQKDVRNLANILTGWSLARPGKDKGAGPGHFHFHELAHEPGDKELMGRHYREAGLAEGELALRDLAHHPATAQHVASKLARHFISDDPPAAAVEYLSRVFLDTDGDLAKITKALIELPHTWERPLAKLKSPQDLVVSTLRATGFHGDTKRLVLALRVLGQAPWTAPSPAGWPDRAEDWAGPDAVIKRVEFATAVAKRNEERLDPGRLARSTIGPVAASETMLAIARAPTRDDGLTLLLSSPEFQRR